MPESVPWRETWSASLFHNQGQVMVQPGVPAFAIPSRRPTMPHHHEGAEALVGPDGLLVVRGTDEPSCSVSADPAHRGS
jgi:hypothetical protein